VVYLQFPDDTSFSSISQRYGLLLTATVAKAATIGTSVSVVSTGPGRIVCSSELRRRSWMSRCCW